MDKKRVMRGVLWGLGGLLLFGLVAMLLWNWLMPLIFGLPKINILHAFGLMLLGRIFFGGFGHGGHGHGHGWHSSATRPSGRTNAEVAAAHMEMADKWRSMSREERRKVMEEMRGKGRNFHGDWQQGEERRGESERESDPHSAAQPAQPSRPSEDDTSSEAEAKK